MATIAVYKFTDYDGWVAAKNRLWSELGSDSYYGESYTDSYFISIYSNCSNPARAAEICSSNGGKPWAS